MVEEAEEKSKKRESSKAELPATTTSEELNTTELISHENAKEVNNKAEPSPLPLTDPLQPLSASNNLQELTNHLDDDLSTEFSITANNQGELQADSGNDLENKPKTEEEVRRPQSARGVHRKKSTSKR